MSVVLADLAEGGLAAKQHSFGDGTFGSLLLVGLWVVRSIGHRDSSETLFHVPRS